MHVFGHHHIADQPEPVFLSSLVENADEGVARSRRTQERQPSVATEGNERQVALSVDSLEAFGHDEKPHAQKPSMGHPKHILLRDVARWCHAQQMFTGKSSENRLGHPPDNAI